MAVRDQPAGKLANKGPRGRTQLFTWMEPRTTARVTRKVSDEMDGIKDALRVKITDITPDFLANWDTASTVGAATLERAPVLTQVLRSAAQTERASRENTAKDCTAIGIFHSLSLSCNKLLRSRVKFS
ncbi:hypothetical protein L210DRAFT_985698 [Boletus edulis BED1]|uniref:Uncharacterized protein n=1 Tax=Boletus edulis BED1 TaxID=1328754 RepID=A0AAD4BG80_BOLED|nr:hypothetical protein L210DRAFT_985698 [Boletus edulis BED1]